MAENYFLYIMTNQNNTVLYTGVTRELSKRISQHREKAVSGFTERYNVEKLVYYEIFKDSYHAIASEKQIKGGSRQKKMDLINSVNPKWRDLSQDL